MSFKKWKNLIFTVKIQFTKDGLGKNIRRAAVDKWLNSERQWYVHCLCHTKGVQPEIGPFRNQACKRCDWCATSVWQTKPITRGSKGGHPKTNSGLDGIQMNRRLSSHKCCRSSIIFSRIKSEGQARWSLTRPPRVDFARQLAHHTWRKNNIYCSLSWRLQQTDLHTEPIIHFVVVTVSNINPLYLHAVRKSKFCHHKALFQLGR